MLSINVGENLDSFLHKCQNLPNVSNSPSEKLNILWSLSRKKVWSTYDKSMLLETLSDLLLNNDVVAVLNDSFSNILPEIFHRVFKSIISNDNAVTSYPCLLQLSLKLLQNGNVAKLVIYEIVQLMDWIKENEYYQTLSDEDTLIYVEVILKLSDVVEIFISFCDINYIVNLMEHSELTIRWFASKIYGSSLNITDLDSFLKTFFNEDEFQSLLLYDLKKKNRIPKTNESQSHQMEISEATDSLKPKELLKSDFIGNYIPLSNFLFPYYSSTLSSQVVNLVPTGSLLNNLNSIVIAVLSEYPVLLSGDIGSGKTALVEYFAQCIGRKCAPDLLKLQLGDQTDSKSLIGTYVCSDKPGEFMWQPGTLTQALQNGSWILLEDIDTAPADVIACLISLINFKSLMITGLNTEIKAANGFQIFATTRHGSGFSHQHNQSMQMFAKLCHNVNVTSPTKEELIQIVQSKYPKLKDIAVKMVDIYSLVSSDKNLKTDEDIEVPLLSFSSRKSTPRDLLKWCSRTTKSLSNNDMDSVAEYVFRNAMQCFSLSNPDSQERLQIGYSLGAKLSLSKEKIEHFILNYKPKVKRTDLFFQIGDERFYKRGKISNSQQFAFTKLSLHLLENIAICVKNNEPVLLVGETGCGKTSCVQFLAKESCSKLHVINMNQQTDIADLIGGFKPMEIKQIIKPAKEDFETLFVDTYSRKQNAKFLGHVHQCFSQKKWSILVKLMAHCCKKAIGKPKKESESDTEYIENQSKWINFQQKLSTLQEKVSTEQGLTFSFLEGALINALKNGDWILLDEVNLASAETLECLSSLLDSSSGSMVLTERGDIKPIKRHENFRIFACMNPATDVGKKDLPYGIRNRFTEIFVEELRDVSDLKTLVAFYLQNHNMSSNVIDGIVNFYLDVKIKSKEKLLDGAGSRPHFSLRTLCRGLDYAINMSTVSPLRAVYEGLCMSFLTQLNRVGHPHVIELIKKHAFEGVRNISSILSQPLPKPSQRKCVSVEGYWLNIGSQEPKENKQYVLTESVRMNLKDLARIVAGGKNPVLLQGETSVGKTSLITYLSELSGNQCVRINNHEHTDIQEYIGSYGADDNGNLIFKEGVLVTAVRHGHWIILDELNLAPTDVLEALNRLLDDNRELFIAETQEVVKAHKGFMLFATQNPPGHYGGRKMLSRAFRNRFAELHFDEIPSKELEEILHKRCHLPRSYCQKFVKVMLDLQVRRKKSGIFAGKHSFMTLRDLFRWAERYRLSENDETFSDWEQCIAEDGYMLIAGRCRKDEECIIVKEIIEKNFKRKLLLENLFNGNALSTKAISEKVLSMSIEQFQHIVWTSNMKRLAILAGRALQFGEAILLVGETGCGKTTVCQLYASMNNAQLYSVNCHMHTESGDFLGGLRPIRNKETDEHGLFEWCDGPLVEAMKQGEMFLIDEISLADDSVLERLNSILETDRMLVLSEKGEVKNMEGKASVEVIKATSEFRLVATMNPGGDFGKKELSPALRNRFTEIWCSPSDSYMDMIQIIEHNVAPGITLNKDHVSSEVSGFGEAIVGFLKWFKSIEIGSKFVVSIRDILSWVQFINVFCSQVNTNQNRPLNSPIDAYIHGACLVFLDSIGSGNSTIVSGEEVKEVHERCLTYLRKQAGVTDQDKVASLYENTDTTFGISPFYIPQGPLIYEAGPNFNFETKTTKTNCLRLLRGLQVDKPILLEGSPGVGKTSLVLAIAKMAGYPITRINLSEETDVTDLFGSDLPVEGGKAGEFAWTDGPLLKALKAGHWIIFDELNLASQSVLEGLNSCFDHRAELFIPALSKSFQVDKTSTKIFACQNPLNQGGGRKGLPKSFLNRFTKVYVDMMDINDMHSIISTSFPNMDKQLILNMVKFNDQLHQKVTMERLFGRKGSPWEFNIRDLIRWCELIESNKESHPGDFVSLIYGNRMRDMADKQKILSLYKEIFNDNEFDTRRNTELCKFQIKNHEIQIGHSMLPQINVSSAAKHLGNNYQLLRSFRSYFEAVMKCIEMKWMAILVGREGSTKNSLIYLLSELSGNHLEVLSMNSSMDTTDIIGGFEQVNLFNDGKDVCSEMISFLNNLLGSTNNTTTIKSLLNIKTEITGYENSLGNKKYEEFNFQRIIELLDAIREFGLVDDVQIENLVVLVQVLQQKFEKINESKGRFQWNDGVLVQALKKGYWLLVENVNFCSSSILDRLNGLLEPNGELTIDERGVINGEIPKVKPHPNFRLFFSMNPKYGEISRAMRNRGIEIYIPSPLDGFEQDEIDLLLFTKSYFNENQQNIAQLILSIHEKINSMTHNKFKRHSHLSVASIVKKLLERGINADSAIKQACEEVYLKASNFKEDKTTIEEEIDRILSDSVESLSAVSNIIPFIPSVKDYKSTSTIAYCHYNTLPLYLISTAENPLKSLVALLLLLERFDKERFNIHQANLKTISSDELSTRFEHIHQFLTIAQDTSLSIADYSEDIIKNGNYTEFSRCYFMVLQILNGVYDVTTQEEGLLTSNFTFQVSKLSRYPHKAIPYLLQLNNTICESFKQQWNLLLPINSTNDFSKVELAYNWFTGLLKYCYDCFRNKSLNINFSLTQLIFCWKWFTDYFYSILSQSDLPDELQVLFDQVNTFLGHDATCHMFYTIACTIGLAKPFATLNQYESLKLLISCDNNLLQTNTKSNRKDLLNLSLETADDASCISNIQQKVLTMKAESSHHPSAYTDHIINESYKTLMYQSLMELLYKLTSSSNDTLDSIDAIVEYALLTKQLGLYDLFNLKSLALDISEKKALSFAPTEASLYSIKSTTMENVISVEESDEKSKEWVDYLSTCVPVFSSLKKYLHKNKRTNMLEINGSIKQIDNMVAILTSYQQLLWRNINKILSSTYNTRFQSLYIAFNDIFVVLKAVSSMNENASIDNAITSTKEAFKQNNITDIANNLHALIKLLQQDTSVIPDNVLKLLIELLGKSDFSNEKSAGIVEPLISCLSSILLFDVTKLSLKYDPVEEIRSRLVCLNKQLGEVNSELQIRYDSEKIWSGFHSYDFSSKEAFSVVHLTSFPERVNILMESRKQLIAQIDSTESHQAARPTTSNYVFLYDDFHHFIESIGNTKQLSKFMLDIHKLLKNDKSKLKVLNEAHMKIKSIISSIDHFINKIETNYPLYIDIILQPINSLKKFQHAAQRLLKIVIHRIDVMELGFSYTVHPSDVFRTFTESIAKYPIGMLNTITDTNFVLAFSNLCKQNIDFSEVLLIKMSLMLLSNYMYDKKVLLKSNGAHHFYNILNKVLDNAYLLWCHKKQTDFEEQLRNESLFKYKTKVHCEQKTEEEEILEQQKKLFATFDEEYSSLLPVDSLNGGSTQPNVSQAAVEAQEQPRSNTVDIDEVFIYKVCQAIYCKENVQSYKKEITILSLEEQLKLLQVKEVMNGVDFNDNITSLLIMINELYNSLTNESTIDASTFNIYNDYNIKDSLHAKQLLLAFKLYVDELLVQFEEHPALLLLLEIIDKILSLAVTSPVMKLLAGFEFLLNQAQNWESYAGSHVSLRSHLEKITEKVIEWRKLELNTWPHLLNKTEEKFINSASKWWFLFYNVVHEYRKIETKDEQKKERDNLATTVKEYLEQSLVGDFESRLKLLFTLIEHIKIAEDDQHLCKLLWNIYMYYNNFLPVVQQYKENHKKPIEKELKDYVKIARWNDINFYAMKQAVDKSHRALNKFIRRYQSTLNEPIEQFFKDQSSSAINFKLKKEFHLNQSLLNNFITQPVFYMENVGDVYLNKVEVLQTRMIKHVTTIVNGMSYGTLIEQLDGFTGDVISGIKELQVDNILSLPKEKQKSARNTLQQQKRKALSSIYKELKSLGISYRKGLTYFNSTNESMSNLPVIQLSNTEKNSMMTDLVTSSNEYFFKCILKQSFFNVSLNEPSKEIGPNDITRFKGISGYLLNIAVTQRSKIAEAIDSYEKLNCVSQGLHHIKENLQIDIETSPVPLQDDTMNGIVELTCFLDRVQHTIHHLVDVLNCRPNDTIEDEITSPYAIAALPFISYCNSSEVAEIQVKIQGFSKCIENIRNKLHSFEMNEEHFPLLDWRYWNFLLQSFSTLKNEFERIMLLKDSFALPSDENHLFKPLIKLEDELKSAEERIFKTILDTSHSSNKSTEINDSGEKCVEHMLIGVQTLVKKCKEYKLLLNDMKEDDDSIMLNGHLEPLLNQSLYQHFDSLNLKTLNSEITTMITTVQNHFQSAHLHNENNSAFLNVKPLLEIYTLLNEYYLFHLLSLHRATSKMLYVFYGLFADLLTKGFCPPAEEEDNTAVGEGATEFEDIEGGGLGAGEGVKDVSDQIESEDQVEDTKHKDDKNEQAADEQEQEDIKEEKEGIEMSDDFESKLEDMDLDDENDSSDDNEDNADEEADKQMGDVENEEQEKIDEKMWGEDDQDDEEDEKKEEEKGQGAEGESQSELVAKDDTQGEQEGNDKKEENKNNTQEEINEQDIDDEKDETEESNLDKERDEKVDGEDFEISDETKIDEQQDKEDEENEKAEEDETGGDEVEQMEDKPLEDDDQEDAESEEKLDEKDDEKKNEPKKDEENEELDDVENHQDETNENPSLPYNNENAEKTESTPDDVNQQSLSMDSEMQQNENKDENEGLGRVESENRQGHVGNSDSFTKQQPEKSENRKRKEMQKSHEDRTLAEESTPEVKRRKAVDQAGTTQDNQPIEKDSNDFEHVKDNVEDSTTELTVDSATHQQLNKLDKPQTIPPPLQDDDDVEMMEEEEVRNENNKSKDQDESEQKKLIGVSEELQHQLDEDEEKEDQMDDSTQDEMNSNQQIVASDFFTVEDHVTNALTDIQDRETMINQLRDNLEENLISLSKHEVEVTDVKAAMETWMKYEQLTAPLAQQLCEQLRLVLEPTLASKMIGDYRTGKRLNMRKVIPYIASQFRKDKIWLRRTKKSKRQYEIMVAVDDSSSMGDNHSKQLAFEAIAVISNALRWLEAGQLAVCSFGEEARVIHPFDETFNEQAGAHILQHFTFEQKKTKIAQLLNMSTVLLNDAKAKQSSRNNAPISQLLLIISDGRGIFLEGKEVVERASMNAREAGIFTVFLILDNPKNKDSILDIKFPIFKPGGAMPEIKRYIEEFPFPFYVLLRDINSLPSVLSDALKQWFELVTQTA